MKTNQLMVITIPLGHKEIKTFAQHKEQMILLEDLLYNSNDIIEKYNLKRESIKPIININEIIRRKKFWEYAITLHNYFLSLENIESMPLTYQQIALKSNKRFPEVETKLIENITQYLTPYIDNKGRVTISKLLPKFSGLIRKETVKQKEIKSDNTTFMLESKGTWANSRLAIYFARQLNIKIEFNIDLILHDKKLLISRDNGGDAHNKLTNALKEKFQKNPTYLMQITSLKIRHLLSIKNNRGYNLQDHTPEIQQKRTQILNYLLMFINQPAIKTEKQYINHINQLNL